MTKLEFIDGLKSRLSGLPENDLNERLSFYGEMIDDIREEGKSEEEAVNEIGDIDRVAQDILSEYPLSKIVKEKVKPKRKFKAWEIVLLALGSPIWASLIIALLAVVFAFYVSIIAIIVSLWAVFGSVLISSLASVAGGIYFMASGHPLSGVAVAGAGVFCAGLSIFLFFGCKQASRGIIILTKKIALSIKKAFIKKEALS